MVEVLGGTHLASRGNLESQNGSSSSLLPNKMQSKRADDDYSITTTIVAGDNRNDIGCPELQSHSFSNLLRNWWLELLSCVVIVAALAAMVITGYEYEGKPLPSWPKGTSVNSLFSLYISVLKTALLLISGQGLLHLRWIWFASSRPLIDMARYDKASRGPLGSLLLLFTSRGRDFTACVGAFVIISALALDFVAQQLIVYTYCSLPLSASTTSPAQPIATLARTNSYSERGVRIAEDLATVSLALQDLINFGMFGYGNTSPFECSSGNCTFPEFGTVGYRSRCTDISSDAVYSASTNFTNLPAEEFNNYDKLTNIASTGTLNTTVASITLPSGLYTNVTTDWPRTYSSMMTGIHWKDWRYLRTVVEFAFVSVRKKLWDEGLGGIDPCSVQYSDWMCQGYGAARCTLEPVVYTVSATVKGSNLEETLSIATDEFAFAGLGTSTLNISCLSDKEKNDLQQVGYQILPDMQWLPYNVSWVEGNWSSATDVPNSMLEIVSKNSACRYQIGTISENSLEYFFKSYFNMTVTDNFEQAPSHSIAQHFFNNANTSTSRISEIMKNITGSMTSHIRQTGDEGLSLPALGEVWGDQTCIRVRWPLFTYPAILVILTVTFFITILNTTRTSQPGISHGDKVNPLTIMFTSLEEHTVNKIMRKVNSNEKIEIADQMKEIFVRLQPTSNGWKFVEDDKRSLPE